MTARDTYRTLARVADSAGDTTAQRELRAALAELDALRLENLALRITLTPTLADEG
jgi:ferritin-like metal-binding protein YciE